MGIIVEELARKASNAVKYWWLLLIVGILSVAAGITVFCYPGESYVTLTYMFGILLLISGIAELITSLTSRNYFMNRGYNVVGGIIDILVGILLCAVPGITAVSLPIFLGFWLTYHSFMIIGSAGDLKAFGVQGTGWLTAGGILLLIFSILILINPFSFGVSAVVVLLGIALLLFGCLMIGGSVRLKNIGSYIKELKEKE